MCILDTLIKRRELEKYHPHAATFEKQGEEEKEGEKERGQGFYLHRLGRVAGWGRFSSG